MHSKVVSTYYLPYMRLKQLEGRMEKREYILFFFFLSRAWYTFELC